MWKHSTEAFTGTRHELASRLDELSKESEVVSAQYTGTVDGFRHGFLIILRKMA